MKCEFSETQFVFGIMSELVNRCWGKNKGWQTPFFPTQRQEKTLGYDANINGTTRVLFFQYKVPEKMITRKAKHWKAFGMPYYEFHLWPDDISHQHNKLVELANADPRNRVYYCSPGFNTVKEFEHNYYNNTISKKSIYVPCKTLAKISGNDKHDICYTLEPARIHKMYSEEKTIKAFDIDELMADIESGDSYINAHDCLINIANYFSIDVSKVQDDVKMYDIISKYLLMNINVFMVLLGECE